MSFRKPQSVAGLFAWIFSPFALAHFISYLFRTINAVIYPDLARDLALEAGNLGLLTSVYFLTFAAAQLPIGVALDRFGPRKVQIPLLTTAAAGALLFAHARDFPALVAARALIGLGVAGSLMAAIKAVSLWLPPARLPLCTGLLLAVGGLGAMASTAPMHAVLTVIEWRGAFMWLSVFGLCVALLILFAVPEHARGGPQTGFKDMLSAVVQLYTSRRFWRLALFSLFAHATYMAVQGLWMGPWLRDAMQLDRAAVADALFASTAAMVAGSLSFGWITDRMQRSGFQPLLVCGGGIVLFLGVQFAMAFGIANPYLAAAAFGFFGTATTMNYAIVAQSVPGHLTGRVTTCFNLLIFLLAFAVQWGFGGLINLWDSAPGGVYPQGAYRFAFLANLALQVPGLLLWLSFRPWIRTSDKDSYTHLEAGPTSSSVYPGGPSESK